MKAKSIKGNSTGEIHDALRQRIDDGFKPTLAFVFLSFKEDRTAICKLLDENGIAIFGATTNGQFIDEETQSATITMLLLDMNPEYFYISFEEYPEKKY